MLKFISCLMLPVFLCGCENPNQNLGTILGAGLGGLAGSQIGGGKARIVSAVVGATLGSLLGSSIGAKLDANDRKAAESATAEALEKGTSDCAVAWQNPDTGHSGRVIPKPVVKTASGKIRRPFQQIVCIDGKETVVHGVAERGPDGRWHLCANQ